MNQRGIFSIFVGQAGVQMGNAFWELLCAEHGVDVSGSVYEDALEFENNLMFFQKNSSKHLVPRCLFVDLEPSVIDEIRTGSYRSLYHPDMLINGFEDSGGNFARGFFTVGKLIMPRVCDQLRKTLESDMTIIGILVFRSLGGGTGAGLTSAIFDVLIDLPKVTRIEVPIYPSPLISSSVVEPYNSILSEHFCMEDVELALLFDNEALYEICSRNLNTTKPPTFSSINRIVAYTLSCITGSLRFQSILNCDLNVLQTNIVPYPRIHFPVSNFAPILTAEKINHHRLSVGDLTHMVFDPSNQLVKVDTLNGKFMSCTMFYRGNVSPYEVYKALQHIKSQRSIVFVDWCPTGFKVSISNPAQVNVEKNIFSQSPTALAMLTNTSSVAKAWCRINSKFQLLYIKKAFMHWFVGEGLEECEFDEAQTNIASLVRDYVEACDEDYECAYIGKNPNKEIEYEDVSLPKVEPKQDPSHNKKFRAKSIRQMSYIELDNMSDIDLGNKTNNNYIMTTNLERLLREENSQNLSSTEINSESTQLKVGSIHDTTAEEITHSQDLSEYEDNDTHHLYSKSDSPQINSNHTSSKKSITTIIKPQIFHADSTNIVSKNLVKSSLTFYCKKPIKNNDEHILIHSNNDSKADSNNCDDETLKNSSNNINSIETFKSTSTIKPKRSKFTESYEKYFRTSCLLYMGSD